MRKIEWANRLQPELLVDLPINNLELMINSSDWGMERKRDGHRCLVSIGKRNEIITVSRQLKPISISSKIKKALQGTKRILKVRNREIILDGELVWVDTQFKDHRTKAQAGLGAKQIYAIWTIANLDLEYYERKKILLDLCNKNNWLAGSPIEFQPLFSTPYSKQGARIRAEYEGWEGFVFKYLHGKYKSGRNNEAVRWKFKTTGEYIVIGYTESDKDRNPYRALVLARYKGKKLVARGQCGGGFPSMKNTNKKPTRQDIYKEFLENKTTFKTLSKNKSHKYTDKNWRKPYGTIKFLYPKDWFVVEIESQRYTENGVPFMPQFKAIRRDKKTTDCKEE